MSDVNAPPADGLVIWITGIPASGKTTTARVLQDQLRKRGFRVEILDGDEIRENLSPELGFSRKDRELNAKRVTYISLLLSRNGIITIVALISPFRATREYARRTIGSHFIEVWAKCSVEACSRRDVKGIYKRAFEGSLTNLTGVQDSYEAPVSSEVVIDTEFQSPEECVQQIMAALIKYGI
jgi:adenylylsulfate kinase